MKKLEFTQPFGNYQPGDVIEVEDDAVFDTAYLKEARGKKAAPAGEDR